MDFQALKKVLAQRSKLFTEGNKLLADHLKGTSFKFTSLGGAEILIVEDEAIATGVWNGRLPRLLKEAI